MIEDLVLKNRSYRRFHEDVSIERSTLVKLVDLARLSGTAGNKQPLKFCLSCDRETNERIFPHLAWAGYLTDWPGPSPGERPAGYIVILGDTSISEGFGCDHGIASQSILLGAVERGLGGCMIGAIHHENLRKALEIPEDLNILLVLALGKPKEEVVMDEIQEGNVRYWRDEKAVHHVPKRPLKEIIIH